MPITVEHVDFVSIPTRDPDRSRRFYLETLGLPLDRETPVGFEVTAGQVTLAVWQPETMGLPFAPNANEVALRVPDVADARRALEAAGVEFAGDVIDTGVCHMTMFKDPDGNALMLHRRYAPAGG
jgi:catechol 2,3-dioxygenase-like lactoylglutathione lyase family enzyme